MLRKLLAAAAAWHRGHNGLVVFRIRLVDLCHRKHCCKARRLSFDEHELPHLNRNVPVFCVVLLSWLSQDCTCHLAAKPLDGGASGMPDSRYLSGNGFSVDEQLSHAVVSEACGACMHEEGAQRARNNRSGVVYSAQ